MGLIHLESFGDGTLEASKDERRVDASCATSSDSVMLKLSSLFVS